MDNLRLCDVVDFTDDVKSVTDDGFDIDPGTFIETYYDTNDGLPDREIIVRCTNDSYVWDGEEWSNAVEDEDDEGDDGIGDDDYDYEEEEEEEEEEDETC